MLLVGNGGAARGAAFALVDAGAKLAIVGRNPDRVRALAKICDAEPLAAGADERALLRRCGPRDSARHAPPYRGVLLPRAIPADLVFDMVYNPLETLLVRHAREQRKEVVPGIQMFLEQAAHQFEIWTGETAPRAAMEKAALEALGSPAA